MSSYYFNTDVLHFTSLEHFFCMVISERTLYNIYFDRDKIIPNIKVGNENVSKFTFLSALSAGAEAGNYHGLVEMIGDRHNAGLSEWRQSKGIEIYELRDIRSRPKLRVKFPNPEEYFDSEFINRIENMKWMDSTKEYLMDDDNIQEYLDTYSISSYQLDDQLYEAYINNVYKYHPLKDKILNASDNDSIQKSINSIGLDIHTEDELKMIVDVITYVYNKVNTLKDMRLNVWTNTIYRMVNSLINSLNTGGIRPYGTTNNPDKIQIVTNITDNIHVQCVLLVHYWDFDDIDEMKEWSNRLTELYNELHPMIKISSSLDKISNAIDVLREI